MTNNKADDPAAGVDAAAEDVALKMGADAFLSKPFTKEKLLTSVSALLN